MHRPGRDSSGAPSVELTVESDASGAVGLACPRLTWRVDSSAREWMQVETQLEWACEGVTRAAVITGSTSSLVAWPFPTVDPRGRGSVRVRVVSVDGRMTGWSAAVALMNPSPQPASGMPTSSRRPTA